MNVRGEMIDLSEPLVMGILNCTPDSFYTGSRMQTEREIAMRAQQIVDEGGRIIDVGAFSTRPGADVVTEGEEMQRLETALRIVRREWPDVIVSVDTYRPLVARRCVEEWGADIVNDVGGISGVEKHGTRSEMIAMISRLRVPYIYMSSQPTIDLMLQSWKKDVALMRSMGVNDIIFDPGFGFGKTVEENYAVMRDLDQLQQLELPLLVGVSRKSMIWKVLGGTADTALNGTTALHSIALMKGASILRVHDVKEAVETILLFKRVCKT